MTYFRKDETCNFITQVTYTYLKNNISDLFRQQINLVICVTVTPHQPTSI